MFYNPMYQKNVAFQTLWFEKVREKIYIRKQQAFVRNVIIESTPHENKMAGKGQITSERARKR